MSSQLPNPVLDPPSPVSRLLGYARVSTDDQDWSLQVDALQQHGIPKTAIFMDKVSATPAGLLFDRQGRACFNLLQCRGCVVFFADLET